MSKMGEKLFECYLDYDGTFSFVADDDSGIYLSKEEIEYILKIVERGIESSPDDIKPLKNLAKPWQKVKEKIEEWKE